MNRNLIFTPNTGGGVPQLIKRAFAGHLYVGGDS
jgi:hypothetical protein